MLRRTMVATIAVMLVMFAGTAMAQQCSVGVYADQLGADGYAEPPYNNLGSGFSDPFYVYSILFTEDFANAVAWSVNIQGLGTDILEIGRLEYGNFLDATPQGYRLGLGDCVIGFNHTPIKLIRHQLIARVGSGARLISVGPNTLEHPTNPIYSTCQSVLVPCGTSTLTITLGAIPTDSESWGSVKALYND